MIDYVPIIHWVRRRPIYNDMDSWPFESIYEAAAAFNLSHRTLYNALSTGKLTAGRRWAYVGNDLPKSKRRKISIIDLETQETWPSAWLCAKELNFNWGTMIRWISVGKKIAGRKLAIGPDYRKGTRHARPEPSRATTRRNRRCS